MNSHKIKEELLREAAAFGDEEGVRALLDSGVDINSQHAVNGWTALHWAAKREHTQLVRYLLSKDADTSLTSASGESVLSLAANDEIRCILSGKSDNSSECKAKPPLPITPNYLSNPALAPKIVMKNGKFSEEWNPNVIQENDSKRKLEEGKPDNSSEAQEKPSLPSTSNDLSFPRLTPKIITKKGRFSEERHPNGINGNDSKQNLEEELVLKVRIAKSFEDDFIEIEVPLNERSYENVIRICCNELNVRPNDVMKLRKLPNTVVRKDKDVLRFQNFQELELVVKAENGYSQGGFTT